VDRVFSGDSVVEARHRAAVGKSGELAAFIQQRIRHGYRRQRTACRVLRDRGKVRLRQRVRHPRYVGGSATEFTPTSHWGIAKIAPRRSSRSASAASIDGSGPPRCRA
jgi:hypothetical protein